MPCISQVLLLIQDTLNLIEVSEVKVSCINEVCQVCNKIRISSGNPKKNPGVCMSKHRQQLQLVTITNC